MTGQEQDRKDAGELHAGAKRLLVVEDERIVALDLQCALRDLGYEVVGTAATAEEALRLAEQHRPDLVLMDIRLQGEIDGIETASRLRRRMQVPIVYLTANADFTTLDRALDTDPGGYLAKPYSQATLRSTIEVALRRFQLELGAENRHLTERRRLEERAVELTELAQRLRQQATLDPLTGLFNRRHLDEALTMHVQQAQERNYPLAVVIVDIDHFKQLNDLVGHVAADHVLKGVANVLLSRVRAYDIPCRYGGEEFVVILPGASAEEGQVLAEDLRQQIERMQVQHKGVDLPAITASFGVAARPRDGSAAQDLVEAADAALYSAKQAGRNRVASRITFH